VPVILITTEAEKGRVLEAVQAGVSDYLVKPFETEGLRAKLQKFVGAAVA
jgi:two-component system chemotaxis response regulator CheY